MKTAFFKVRGQPFLNFPDKVEANATLASSDTEKGVVGVMVKYAASYLSKKPSIPAGLGEILSVRECLRSTALCNDRFHMVRSLSLINPRILATFCRTTSSSSIQTTLETKIAKARKTRSLDMESDRWGEITLLTMSKRKVASDDSDVSRKVNVNTIPNTEQKGALEPDYSVSIRFKKKLFQVRVTLHHIPAKFVNLNPTATHFYLDTFGFSKKFHLQYDLVPSPSYSS